MTKERFCWCCATSLGRVDNRYYKSSDTCGSVECARELQAALAETADRAPAADVVERLRSGNECHDPCKVREARSGCLCAEAADEIERLRAQPRGLDPATVEACAEREARMREALKAWEKWEADIIMTNECWRGELPAFTKELWDRIIPLQELRNAALQQET